MQRCGTNGVTVCMLGGGDAKPVVAWFFVAIRGVG